MHKNKKKTLMKNSYYLEKYIDSKYYNILMHDKLGIDNPDKYNPYRLKYIDRIKIILSIITKRFPFPEKINVGDFACAQGNISLILAELGYHVHAIDINPIFIEYSKIKYEKGNIHWINNDIENLNMPSHFLDIAVIGELIEHCAFPEVILNKIFKHVRLGGIIIVTTPNASRVLTKLPSFKQFINKKQRKIFKKKQFGPDSKDHLFLFKLEELKHILPKDAEIVKKGYLGSLFLINKYSQPFIKLFPIKFVEQTIRSLSKIPLFNKKLYNNIYVVLKKT